MTSSIRNNQRSGGFTLVELLIVIGMIAALVAILAPAVAKALRQGERLRTSADLQAISVALEAYKRDHGEFPRVGYNPDWNDGDWATGSANPNPAMGAQILCQALIGPLRKQESTSTPTGKRPRPKQDGAEGPGFTTRTGGKVWQPYLPVDRFKVGDPLGGPGDPYTDGLKLCILDANGRPILYFPRSNSKVNIHAPLPEDAKVGSYVGSDISPVSASVSERAMFDADDNLAWFGGSIGRTPTDRPSIQNAAKRIRLMLGDTNDQDGVIDPTKGEKEAFTGEFILWSAGPDQLFGPDQGLAPPRDKLDAADAAKCDDVLNFDR